MGIWYATREQVRSSLEITHASWSDSLVDQKLESSSRSIEGFLHRRFYPERRTVLMDWPNMQSAATWQLWLGRNEIISLETLTSGGTNLTSAALLRRGDDLNEAPYSLIELDLSDNLSFGGGLTFQQSISILGLYGYDDTNTSVPASATLNGTINSSVQTLVLSPSNGKLSVGVGSLLLLGTERIVLTDSRMSDTGQNLGSAMDALNSDVIVDVSDGTLFAKGEVILLGAERMRINDIAGNNLIVSRQWDGSVLTAHTLGEDVYALRTFTAQRGALGSTAASHLDTVSAWAHDYGIVNELCIAETVVALEQNSSGYARTVGSGPSTREAVGGGLEDIRERAMAARGRNKARHGAV